MRTAVSAVVCAVVASLALSGSAMARNMHGTSSQDTLRGTAAADSIQAGSGNDRVAARAGGDRINAGRGRDRVSAGAGSDRVSGGSGADALAGNAGRDVITGGAGSDVITGGDGNDVIDARDGAVDTVTCGAGFDVAKLDADDVIADATELNPNGSCERVRRGGSAGSPGSREDCPEGGARRGDRARPQEDASDDSDSEDSPQL